MCGKTITVPTEMKIAIASQNRRTVSRHAGKCTHFWVMDSADGSCHSLLLSPAQLLCRAGDLSDHPLREVDVLLAASAGQPLAWHLEQVGITLSLTMESKLQAAAALCMCGGCTTPYLPGKGYCQSITGRT
jgi:predicted Fe-Mo cluster-binding NifX family protein